MTQKAFNINYCHIATQGMYRKSRKTETVPLIGGDLIREAFRRRFDQESKFQKSSMKVKFAEIKGISEGFGDTVGDLKMGKVKTCNSECICKIKSK